MEMPTPPEPDPLTDPLSRAVVAEALERGYRSLELADVLERARVDAAEFHARYPDLEACAADTAARLIDAFKLRAGSAFNSWPGWREGLRAAAYEAADFYVEYPETVEFGTNVALQIGEMARVRREEVFGWCAEMIDRGREVAPPGSVPEGASAMAIGSILELLTRRLAEGAEIRPHDTVRESLYGVVRIYLGEEAAREELEMPRPGPVLDEGREDRGEDTGPGGATRSPQGSQEP